MRRMRTAIVIAAVTIAATPASADRRRIATRIAYGGLTAVLLGIAAEGTAAGLGDYPDPQRRFAIAGGISTGIGAIGLGLGLYLRATSPAVAPDAISLDPVRSRHRIERRVAVALTSLGALSVAVGVAHAVGAYRDSSLADAQCPNGVCTANGTRLFGRAQTLKLAAEMLIGPGVVGMMGGIVMYRSARDTSAQIVPVVAPTQIGAAVAGRF